MLRDALAIAVEDINLVVIERIKQAFHADAEALGQLHIHAAADHETNIVVIVTLVVAESDTTAATKAAGVTSTATAAGRIETTAVIAIPAIATLANKRRHCR